MNKLLTVVKWVGCTVAIVAGINYAGKMDYEDAVFQEMKNNGTYHTMSEEHLDWDESRMVKTYVACFPARASTPTNTRVHSQQVKTTIHTLTH